MTSAGRLPHSSPWRRPRRIGLIQGVLQHASPDVSEQHYNLARSTMASRRHAATIAKMPAKLHPRARAERG